MVRPTTKTWWIDFVLLAAVWGSSFLFMRIAVVDFGAIPTALLRAAIGALALLPVLLLRGGSAALLPHWKPVFAAGVLNASIPSAGLAYALLSLTTGMTSIINATVPLFGALIAWLWLSQRPSKLALLGLAAGFVGVAGLAWHTAGVKVGANGVSNVLAMLSAAAGAASGAFSALFARRYLLGVPPVALAAGSQMGASLGLLLPALLLWPAHTPGAMAWLGVAAAGVVCTGVGYLLFFRVVERAGPARALSVTFVMPLFAMAYGYVLLGEDVTAQMLGCAALIIGGTALSTGMLTRRS